MVAGATVKQGSTALVGRMGRSDAVELAWQRCQEQHQETAAAASVVEITTLHLGIGEYYARPVSRRWHGRGGGPPMNPDWRPPMHITCKTFNNQLNVRDGRIHHVDCSRYSEVRALILSQIGCIYAMISK